MNKNQICSTQFEEFFATEYKNEVFNILEKYPEEQSLTIDYQKLEIFDPQLAYLLINKPVEVLEMAQIAIKNIDPLIKDADVTIRFENLTNIIDFNNVDSKYIGQFICVDSTVFNIDKPRPELAVGVFECRGCMRLHEVEQVTHKNFVEPTLCPECGGRTFRLLEEESTFYESQRMIIGEGDTGKRLDVLLLKDECSHSEYSIGNNLRITGILKARKLKNGYDYFLEANYIEKLEHINVDIPEITHGDRNSPEYKLWRKAVIENDKVCQCCGGHKKLEAHHIFSYENNPSYRVNIENGVALCKWCHQKYHSYYGKDATPKNLIKFLKRFGGK